MKCTVGWKDRENEFGQAFTAVHCDTHIHSSYAHVRFIINYMQINYHPHVFNSYVSIRKNIVVLLRFLYKNWLAEFDVA